MKHTLGCFFFVLVALDEWYSPFCSWKSNNLTKDWWAHGPLVDCQFE
jgi:hypothetical protein